MKIKNLMMGLVLSYVLTGCMTPEPPPPDTKDTPVRAVIHGMSEDEAKSQKFVMVANSDIHCYGWVKISKGDIFEVKDISGEEYTVGDLLLTTEPFPENTLLVTGKSFIATGKSFGKIYPMPIGLLVYPNGKFLFEKGNFTYFLRFWWHDSAECVFESSTPFSPRRN